MGLDSSGMLRNSLFVVMFLLFVAEFSMPASAMLLNVSDRNVIHEFRNTSMYTIGDYINMSNISFIQPELRINITSGNGTNYNFSVFVDGVPTPSFNITNNTAVYFNISMRLLNGTHSVLVQFNSSEDENAKRNSSNITFTVDDGLPTIAFSYVTVNATNTSDTTPGLIVNVSDNIAVVDINLSVFVNGAYNGSSTLTANNTNITLNTSSLRNGTFSIQVQVRDPAGNAVNSTVYTVTVDDTPPVFQAFSSTTGATNNATNISDTTPEILLNFTDNVFATINVSVYVGGTFDGTFLATNNTIQRYNLTALSQNTSYFVRLEANDSASNLANGTILTLYLYNGKPVVNILSFPVNMTNSTNTSQIIIFNITRTGNLTASVNSLNYTIFIDGTQNGSSILVGNDTNVTAIMTTFYNGTHFVWVQAIDPAGNRANSTVYTITTDAEAPYAVISSPVNATNTTDLTPEIVFTVVDNSSAFSSVLNYTIFVDGAVNGQTGLTSNGTATRVNLTVLANASHNITIQVSDFLNNTRNSTTSKIVTDANGPALTLTLSASSIYKTNPVTITCTAADSPAGVNSSSSTLSVAKPNGVSTTASCGSDFTDTSAGGTYTVTYSVADMAGNSASTSKTFTSNDPGGAASSSGGGGSSAAAASTPSTTSSKTIIVDAFTAEKPNVVKLISETIGIKEISVDVANKVNSVEIKVTKTDTAPASVTKSVEGKVYQYLEIKHDALKNENIKSAKVKFTVTKKWIADSGISKDKVVLKRFADSQWSNMKTALLSESASEITYESELPGLSVFAIGEDTTGAAPVAQQPSAQQPTQQPSAQTPSQQPSAQQPSVPAAQTYSSETMYYAAGIVVLLIIIGVAWKVSKGRGKKAKLAKK